jgi:exosortase B
MAAVTAEPRLADTVPLHWLALAAGLAALILPTYVVLFNTLWDEEAYEHGLIVTSVFWFLMWRGHRAVLALEPRPAVVSGFALLLGGLFLYFVGRTQNLPLFEVSAHLPLLVAVLLLTIGWQAVFKLWFPLLFMLFLIPLPGFVMLAMTAELKQGVSAVAASLLYHAGYPIARDGVVLTVGQYQMLVADACSGLNSIYSLTAMGLLYLHLMQHRSWWRNGVLLAAIVPVAIFANLVRVLVLILITFHLGDEAGQGFLHGLSGVVLFVVALLSLIALDRLLGLLPGAPRAAAQPA